MEIVKNVLEFIFNIVLWVLRGIWDVIWFLVTKFFELLWFLLKNYWYIFLIGGVIAIVIVAIQEYFHVLQQRKYEERSIDANTRTTKNSVHDKSILNEEANNYSDEGVRREEFEDIISRITKRYDRLETYTGFNTIYGTVTSLSGNSTWHFTLTFSLNWRSDISPVCKVESENEQSTLPYRFARAIQQNIIKEIEQEKRKAVDS